MVKKIAKMLGLLLLLAAAFIAYKMLQPPPDDLDLSTERMSENGLYSVSFLPERLPAKIGPIHAWVVELKDVQGNLVTGAKVALDGGMPQHGHGLPTSPKSDGEIAPGRYRIDGVKFSMSGWWEFKLDIEAQGGSDTAVFNVVME